MSLGTRDGLKREPTCGMRVLILTHTQFKGILQVSFRVKEKGLSIHFGHITHWHPWGLSLPCDQWRLPRIPRYNVEKATRVGKITPNKPLGNKKRWLHRVPISCSTQFGRRRVISRSLVFRHWVYRFEKGWFQGEACLSCFPLSMPWMLSPMGSMTLRWSMRGKIEPLVPPRGRTLRQFSECTKEVSASKWVPPVFLWFPIKATKKGYPQKRRLT